MTISDILFARGNKNKRMNKKQTNEINQSFPLALKKKKSHNIKTLKDKLMLS